MHLCTYVLMHICRFEHMYISMSVYMYINMYVNMHMNLSTLLGNVQFGAKKRGGVMRATVCMRVFVYMSRNIACLSNTCIPNIPI